VSEPSIHPTGSKQINPSVEWIAQVLRFAHDDKHQGDKDEMWHYTFAFLCMSTVLQVLSPA
jgi:hypothetical protein